MSFHEGFTFSRSQKLGILMAFALLSVFILILGIFKYKQTSEFDPNVFVLDEQISKAQSRQLRQIIHPFNINLADTNDFMQLVGIGPVLSHRIINYRKAKGGFSSVEEIRKVYGLKQEVYEQIKSFLYVDSTTFSRKPSRFSTGPHFKKDKYANLSAVDINLADSSMFSAFPGIGPVLSQRIINYRNSRHGFQQIEDLQKVYGLKVEVFQQIKPYLFIDSSTMPRRRITSEQTTRGLTEVETSQAAKPSFEKEEGLDFTTAFASLDLNKADSAQLVQLPGIGEKLAARMIKYRNILGHYVAVEQLRHVYGLSEENFKRMQPFLKIEQLDAFPKIDINAASTWQLSRYPFISKSLASVIIEQRKQLGWFENWEQLHKIEGIDESIVSQLKAYFKMR